jgi:hypothetical protein
MGTEPVPETLYLNQLTQLMAREDYIESTIFVGEFKENAELMCSGCVMLWFGDDGTNFSEESAVPGFFFKCWCLSSKITCLTADGICVLGTSVLELCFVTGKFGFISRPQGQLFPLTFYEFQFCQATEIWCGRASVVFYSLKWCRKSVEKISWTNRVRNREVLHRVKEERNIVLPATEKRKVNWIGHIFRRNCLLKLVTQ